MELTSPKDLSDVNLAELVIFKLPMDLVNIDDFQKHLSFLNLEKLDEIKNERERRKKAFVEREKKRQREREERRTKETRQKRKEERKSKRVTKKRQRKKNKSVTKEKRERE